MDVNASKSYRIRRHFLYLGWACAVGFAAAGIFSTLAALWSIDGSFPRPRLFALVFGLFWATPDNRREIIEFLRKSIAEGIQKHWPRFEAMTAESSTRS